MKAYSELSRSGKFNRLHPECKKNWRNNNPNYGAEYTRNWLKKHPGYYTPYYQFVKLKALRIISGVQNPKCSCGCDNLKFLEVNHKKLFIGGRSQKSCGLRLWMDIITGISTPADFEVTCKVCNWAHYLSLKFGAIYRIEYVGCATH